MRQAACNHEFVPGGNLGPARGTEVLPEKGNEKSWIFGRTVFFFGWKGREPAQIRFTFVTPFPHLVVKSSRAPTDLLRTPPGGRRPVLLPVSMPDPATDGKCRANVSPRLHIAGAEAMHPATNQLSSALLISERALFRSWTALASLLEVYRNPAPAKCQRSSIIPTIGIQSNEALDT